jgi:hypothetical protein
MVDALLFLVNFQHKMRFKLLIILFFSISFIGLTPSPSESIDECQLLAKVLSNLGSSMSRHRLIIAEGSDPTSIDEASRALATETKLYSSANREYQKARCDGWRR